MALCVAFSGGWRSPAVAATTTTTAVATATAAITAAATAAVAAATAAITAAATAALAGGGFVHADHATHPLHILEVVDGLLLSGVVAELHESETALAAGFTVEGEAALADFAVLPKEIKQVFALGLEREVANVDGH
jgi:hypothetical protein